MSKRKPSDIEQEFNNVLNYQSKELSSIQTPDINEVEERIAESEELLKELGIDMDVLPTVSNSNSKASVVLPTWENLSVHAEQEVGTDTVLESLFSEDELLANKKAIQLMGADYNSIHKLDKIDLAICLSAGIFSSVIDILLVGIPKKTPEGLKGGPLSNYVRDWFDKKFPKEEVEKLANSEVSKVPYDAQDNRHTTEHVEGLSAYYHRLLSLGHDPILGFIFGVYDILNGKMTTIDKNGKFLSQVMDNCENRKEISIFAAIAKQIIHLKSDITTPMGLPVPLMGLFNLFQFGNIGEEEQTIAEIVQGMYYEGYDFIHFCSMSVPTMIIEVLIRLSYALKRLKEGHSIKDSIPIFLDRKKHPKLNTMLFIGHSTAITINAGKVYFTKNPMAVNYPQWLVFIKYLRAQFKWGIIKKPILRTSYVGERIADELTSVYQEIDMTFNDFLEDEIVI